MHYFVTRFSVSVQLKALSTCTMHRQVNFTPVILGVGLKPTMQAYGVKCFPTLFTATLYMHSSLLRLPLTCYSTCSTGMKCHVLSRYSIWIRIITYDGLASLIMFRITDMDSGNSFLLYSASSLGIEPWFLPFVLAAFRHARFFSFIISDSAVGFRSNSPVLRVCCSLSDFIAFVRGSASITLVSIHLG